jgi:hypothetical protein
LYRESLAGLADEVRFGLPLEYEAAVREGVSASPVEVVLAAHAQAGSSVAVFRRLAAFLAVLLEEGVPSGDEALWAVWDAVPS